MLPSLKGLHPLKLYLFAALFILTPVVSPASATEAPKVVIRSSVSQRHRSELQEKLKRITGWRDLGFTSEGALVLGTNLGSTGSESARQLLRSSVSGSRMILIEDATGRKDIAFCRVHVSTLIGEKLSTVYVVMIDFADFRQLSGDKQARAAFDVGFAVLHEINHVVHDSTDPKISGGVGDCETQINRMRQELGLPIRTDYYFSLLPLRTDLRLISRFVRLGFHLSDQATGRTKRYWLVWDAALVGGLRSDHETAALF
jgi:hypothetical protein